MTLDNRIVDICTNIGMWTLPKIFVGSFGALYSGMDIHWDTSPALFSAAAIYGFLSLPATRAEYKRIFQQEPPVDISNQFTDYLKNMVPYTMGGAIPYLITYHNEISELISQRLAS